MTGSKRALAVLAAGALITPLISIGSAATAAPGDTNPPEPRSIADVCQNVPEGFDPFDDVANNQLEAEILCLAFAEITLGTSDPRLYRPGANVNRDQMASFIARLIDTANELETEGAELQDLPPSDGVVPFTDVARDNTHREAIDRLAQAGIVQGGPGGRPMTQYGPELDVTRAQMASFIKRALEFLVDGETFSSDSDFFTDDENAQPHEPNINAVAELAIAVGAGNNQFNPFQSVSRAQMAAFLTRTLALLEERGEINPIGAEEEVAPEVTVDTQNVAAGEDIAFTIEADNIDSVAVSADCVDDATFEDDADTTADGFQVVIPVRDDATAGECTVNLLITDNDGQTSEASFTVTIEEAAAPTNPDQQTATDAPELVNTSLENQTDNNVQIRFIFDEDVSGATPNASLFHLYGFDGELVENGSTAFIDSDNTNEVLVTFQADRGEFETVTVATVDFGAVLDADDNGNLEGDDGVQTVTFGSGSTTAPDLVDIGTFDANRHEVEFIFDEAISSASVTASGFLLIPIDTNDPVLVGDSARVDSNNSTIVRVTFSDDANDRDDTSGSTGEIETTTEGETARGAVEAGSVGDSEGNDNPLQVAVVSNDGNTGNPDLVSVTFNLDADSATFTFDESIRVTASPGGNLFQVFDRDGNEIEGQSANRGESNTRVVEVQFQDNQLEEAIGASVDDGAVIATTGAVNRTNDEDQVVVENNREFESGRTTAPDLISSEVQQGTVGSNTGNNTLRVAYVFDEEVDAASLDASRFFIYDTEGDRIVATEVERNEDAQNEVFAVFGDNSDAEINNAVVATVDNDAVFEEDNDSDPATTGTGNVEGFTLLGEGASTQQ